MADGMGGDIRERLVDATLALSAETSWDGFGVKEVAERAGVSLVEFRERFPSKGAILAAFSKRIDRVVLESDAPDLAEESPRERVFDVMMRRLDALTPYRAALPTILEAARGDLAMALALNGVALNSWRFMLASVDVDTDGHLGTLRLQGAALVFSRVLATWLDDDDPSLARTMAVLDRELGRGETILRRAEEASRLLAPLRAFADAVSSRRGAKRGRRDPRDVDRDTRADEGSGTVAV